MPIPSTGFTVVAETVALTTATARTVAGVTSGSNKTVKINELVISADGTSGNLLVELVYGTNASNAPGTNSTLYGASAIRGTDGVEASAATSWTSGHEPTVLAVLKSWRFALPGGPLVIQFPLGREPSGVTAAATQGKFIGVRLTASVGCNADCTIEFEE